MTDGPRPRRWVPAAILSVGCLVNLTISAQRSMPLARPLSAVPTAMLGYQATDIPISDDELRVAGVTSFVNRVYRADSGSTFAVYVGYYPSQRQGSSIHSPKNCLPGAGWEPITSRREIVPSPAGPIRVNRFVIARQDQRAVVYYWYQGRGRTESNEYKVKLDLIRDSALHRRSEEALVRIVVPVTGPDLAAADSLGRQVAQDLYGSLVGILPS